MQIGHTFMTPISQSGVSMQSNPTKMDAVSMTTWGSSPIPRAPLPQPLCPAPSNTPPTYGATALFFPSSWTPNYWGRPVAAALWVQVAWAWLVVSGLGTAAGGEWRCGWTRWRSLLLPPSPMDSGLGRPRCTCHRHNSSQAAAHCAPHFSSC